MADQTEIDMDPSVEFLYKTMLQRDPRKRRVKPVQKHLIQVDFGGADDSDDSDFELDKHKKGLDDSDEDDENQQSSDDGDDDDESEEENEEDEESEEDIKKKSSKKEESFVEEVSVQEESESCLSKEDAIKPEKADASVPYIPFKHKPIKVTICCVCLGDISEEDDEIVECDNCGASVHEGCYGISENHSSCSTESSASTEPWFCDACKAGLKPICELCPNPGGIFKETDAGKWVHLVCALYTPGVAFGDVDKLSPVTLFEMPYSRWGARECTLCEDARFSRTGVCISCDAGMCRTYFHVTCAQREGLLSEAAPEECMDIADPFFAYCKMHAEKVMSRAKRRNWLAIQSHIRKHPEKKIEDEKEKARFERKLKRHQEKYQQAKLKRPPSWVPTQKLVRHLTSSPAAVKKMLRKAELMGVITQSQHVTHEKQEIRKKSFMVPSFSVEFITHFLERNSKIENTKTCMKDIKSQNEKLQEQEKILRMKYDQLYSDVEGLRHCANEKRKTGEKLWSMLNDLTDKKFPVPEEFKVRKPSPSRVINRKNSLTSPPAVIHKCALCHKTNSQHQLAHCDSCKEYYHLGCLDPPLTRMPKKTKIMGWQCSECTKSSSGDSEVETKDLDAPRKLREKIKEPTKWSPDMKFKFEFEKLTKYNMKTKKRKKKKKPGKQGDENEDESKPKKPRTSGGSSSRKGKVDQIPEGQTCAVCNQSGDSSDMVKCDECMLCYHFGCLDPPMKKTPKQRGYSWHCEACDPSNSSEEDASFQNNPDED